MCASVGWRWVGGGRGVGGRLLSVNMCGVQLEASSHGVLLSPVSVSECMRLSPA